VAAIGVAYAIGYRRLSSRSAHPAALRRPAALFVAGYVALVVALLSPLHTWGEVLFSLHMVQHLLLLLVAAPLLLASGSMPVMLWALPRQERSGVGALLSESSPTGKLLRFGATPWVAWLLFVLGQWLWHQPAAYELALAYPLVHYAQHLYFFVSAVLFWWPVIGAPPIPSPLSYPARMLYVFLGWIPNSLLGAGITFDNGILYPHYAASAASVGVNPVSDQLWAGLLMWIPGDLVFASVLGFILAAFLRDEERKAVRIDRELDLLEASRREP